MKTIISVPAEILKAAEYTAKRLGVSRSIEHHKVRDITAELDEIYTVEDSRLNEGLQILQTSTLNKEDWQ